MSKISSQPPSGFRDFLPKEAQIRMQLIQTIIRIYERYGFLPVGAPFVENLSTLQGKGGGSDNEKLIFKILKRGEDLQRSLGDPDKLADLGLRFDLTLPLARYCARFPEQLPRPFKAYQIGPVWRADRPQKGRFREFYQCDVDILGAKEIGAELECLSAMVSVFLELEIADIEVHLNDRQLLACLGEKFSIPAETWARFLVVLDKLDKVGLDGVQRETVEKGILTDSLVQEVLAFFNDSSDAREKFECLHPGSSSNLKILRKNLEELFPNVRIVVSPTLVRGQDYYTGTIFEIRHPQLAGSLGGGGRYNRLLEIFGGMETPAFGGSIGFERLALILEERGLAQPKASTDVFFPLLDENLRRPIAKIAESLRKEGLRVDVYPDAAKLKNQFKYADATHVPVVAILGEEEWKKSQIKVKDMRARTENTVEQKDLLAHVKNMLPRKV